MHSETQTNQRNYIYAVKFFAILSVICAHTAHVSKQNSMENIVAGNILSSLGSIGVPIFFIISGFLFAKGDSPFVIFFKKRITTILIPWMATGTVVYCYVAIRKNGINVVDWLNFLAGNKSYLYFLPMLLACYLIFFFINQNPVRLIIVMLVSLASILLTTCNEISQLNPYINPLNWFFYFGVGYLLFLFGKMSALTAFAKKTINLWALVFLVCLLVCSKNSSIGYWTKEYLVFELIAVICIFGICSYPRVYKSKAINRIGQDSFSIYLLHMPFAGIVAHVFSQVDLAMLTLIRPFIVLFLTIFFIFIYKHISYKLKVDRFLPMFIGSRESQIR